MHLEDTVKHLCLCVRPLGVGGKREGGGEGGRRENVWSCVLMCVRACACVFAHYALWGPSVCECSQAAPVQVTGSCYFDAEDLVAATVGCVEVFVFSE